MREGREGNKRKGRGEKGGKGKKISSCEWHRKEITKKNRDKGDNAKYTSPKEENSTQTNCNK